MSDADDDLGALAARVPSVLLGGAAYHVPQPPGIVAKLDANELPYPLPEDLRAGLAAALAATALERYPDPRAARLRSVVAAQLGVAGERLTFGNGSDELIALLVAAFAAAPAGVLYPTPSFVYYRLAAVARGVPIVEVPLRADFTLDEAALDAAVVAHRPSLVFLALPNNPTGTLWRVGFARELAARHPDVVVVSDEAYLAYCGETNLPAAHGNLVVMRTLSKIGMAGLRVGYTVSSPAIAALLDKVRPPYNLSALDQAAAVYLLEHAAGWCAARARDIIAARDQLALELAALPGIVVAPSRANLLLLDVGAHARATQLWRALAAAGVVVRAFGASGSLAGCLRVTIGTASENALLVRALRDALA